MTCPYCGTRYMGMICPNCNQKTNTAPPPPPATYTYTRKKALRPLLITVIVIVFIMACFAIFHAVMRYTSLRNIKHYNGAQSAVSTQSAGSAVTAKTTAPQKPVHTGKYAFLDRNVFYDEGTYEAGKDIPEGLYMLLPNMEARMLDMDIPESKEYSGEQYRDFHVTVTKGGSEIIRDWFHNNLYINLEKGMTAEFSHSLLIDMSKEKNPLDPFSESGMYLVGTDVPAGNYTVRQNGDAFPASVQIYDKLPVKGIKPVFDSEPDGKELTVTLEDGQYLVMLCCNLVRQ